MTAFKRVGLPTGAQTLIPDDIIIRFPKVRNIALDDHHYLAYIPWNDSYLSLIPETYRDFYRYALPHLHVRTSDVHTAVSVSQLPYLLTGHREHIDQDLVYYALMLHDCGWSMVDQQGLVSSLSYSGVSPTSRSSLKPKQQHLVYGAALAFKLMDAYTFDANGPTDAEQYAISEIIRRHDNDAPWEAGKYGVITPEMNIVCDADRLWSYTHENFWLDTIRKDVTPEAYIATITAEIPTYFFTRQGKARARQLINERKPEVAAYIAAKKLLAADKPKATPAHRAITPLARALKARQDYQHAHSRPAY